MSGLNYFILFLSIYLFSIGYIIFINYKKRTNKILDYFSGTFNPIVLALTFAATLYSAFFLVGLPGFLFAHGIGAWPYIIIGDVIGVLILFLVGKKYIELSKDKQKDILSPLTFILPERDRMLILTYVLTVSVFMIPYLALQLVGIGGLISSVTNDAINARWASALVLILIWTYSSLGGIKSIVLSDAIQGLILFSLLLITSIFVLIKLGGPTQIITSINNISPDHLSLPGPNGFFTFSTMLSFIIVIMLIPLSQPQFLTRYNLLSDRRNKEPVKKLFSVCIGMCIIFCLFSLPIIILGLGGTIGFLNEIKGDQVVYSILNNWTPTWLASLFAVAVLAAAMSTSDSILFSLAQILSQDLLKSQEENDTSSILYSRLFVLSVALVSLFFSFFTSNTLILKLGALAFSGCVIVVPFLTFGLFFSATTNALRVALYSPIMFFILFNLFGVNKIINFDISLISALLGTILVILYNLYDKNIIDK